MAKKTDGRRVKESERKIPKKYQTNREKYAETRLLVRDDGAIFPWSPNLEDRDDMNEVENPEVVLKVYQARKDGRCIGGRSANIKAQLKDYSKERLLMILFDSWGILADPNLDESTLRMRIEELLAGVDDIYRPQRAKKLDRMNKDELLAYGKREFDISLSRNEKNKDLVKSLENLEAEKKARVEGTPMPGDENSEEE